MALPIKARNRHYMTIRISAQEVRRLCLDNLRPWARDNLEFYAEAGQQHYRLLAYLSTQVSGTIIDIGTHRGASAIALSYNTSNRVLTFDIEDRAPSIVDHRNNIVRFIEDLTTPAIREKHRRTLLESPLIFLDIDPHEGDREWAFLEWLREAGYRGVVVLDDVWHFKPLREKVWYRLPRAEKIDLTSVGHWSGTGLVSFGARPDFDEEPSTAALRDWTLVTGYFDLTQEPDANDELRARPPEHYLETHSTSTLALEHDLVIFTEPKFEEIVWSKRPEHLRSRTTIVAKRFSDFPLFTERQSIWNNRVSDANPDGFHCMRDPRNTASYYLFCMARYAMIKEAAVLRPTSTHFAWINVCIERMGIRNVVALDMALELRRKKFSTCRIGYARPDLAALESFFGRGGCSNPESSCGGCTFCSGFFTGGRDAMLAVCDLMEKEFRSALAQGYGHADEQLMALVHARRPELFEWYVGDYAEMITNYDLVHENPEKPLYNLILPAIAASNWEAAFIGTSVLWISYVMGQCRLSTSDLEALLWAKREVRKHT